MVHRSTYGVLVRNLDIVLLSDIEYLVWPDQRQLRHLFFCINVVRLSFVVFTFEHLS